jgi:hypothetical protein
LQEENDEKISMKEEVCEEEDMAQPKLGDVLEPLDDDSNTQTQNSIAIYEAPYTFCEGIQNLDNPSYYFVPLLASNMNSEIIDKKECCLDMLYDNALDDGPMLMDNPPCLHEDRNDILVIHDDALIHESPILFLKSLIYTIEEKCAYVEKYLCVLQLSYEKSYCNHDAMIKNDICNYLKEESMLMNALINLMILSMCVKFPNCMIQMFKLLNFLVIATTMEEEVLSTLFMLLVMILCVHLLVICNGIPILSVI